MTDREKKQREILIEVIEDCGGHARAYQLIIDQALSELNATEEVGCEEIKKVIEKHKWNIAKYVMENKTLDVGQSSNDLAQALKDKFIITRRS